MSLSASLGRVLAFAVVGTTMAACSKSSAPVPPAPRVKTFEIGSAPQAASAVPAQSSLRSEGQTVSILSDEKSLRAELDGTVVEVLVRAGEAVKAGQAVARLDPADTRLADSAARVQSEAAKAELAAAEADFRRFERLRNDSFISQAEFDRRRAQLAVARAQYEAKLDQLGVLSSRALAAGRVNTIDVSAGQPVKSGQVLATIVPAKPAASSSPAADISGVPANAVQVPLGSLINGTAVLKVVPLDAPQANGATHQLRRIEVKRLLVDVEGALVVGEFAKGDRVVALGAHLLQDGQAVRLLP